MAKSIVTRLHSVCILNFNLDFNLPKTKRKNMKQQAKMITLVMCLMSLIGIGSASAQTLVLHHADGTTTDVELYLMPRIQFQNDHVLITSSVLDMDYPKESVLRFSYKGVTNDVKAVKRDADYSRENGQLVFHGIGQTDKVAVYNTNGIRVPVRLSSSGNDVTLPLASIPSGVYVLSVNGRTSKFSKP